MNGNTSFLGSSAFRYLAIALFLVAVVAVFVAVPSLTPFKAKDEVRITMWTSGEKMTYLKDVVAQYNKDQHLLDGSKKKIHVDVVQVNSGPMSDYLVGKIRDGVEFPDGVPAPQIISPSVDSWLTRINYLTQQQVFDMQDTKALALTPVVIAMYEEMARCLGWPAKELGWSDIIALAQSPDGWAAYPCAKAEWGKKPLLAWTDPSVSSTARSALFATFSAAAGKPAELLTQADVHDPKVQQYVHNLQSAVDHYFPETLKLQAKLFDGPKFVQFVPLEEYSLVWLKDGLISDGTSTRPLDRRMVAIYPKEGTVWHNNPGGILRNVPWSSQEQQQAAAQFVDFLLQPAQQAKAADKGFRSANPSVASGPKISAEYGIDPKQPTRLLGAVDPAVAEEILNSWQDVKKPAVVVLVVDTSGSMEGDKIARAKEGADAFLDTVSVNDYVGLITFSTTVNKTIPVGPISKNKFDLAGAIDGLNATGSTALYDALKSAIQMADAYPVSGDAIRAVLLLSDGESNAGTIRLCDLIQLQDDREVDLGCPGATGKNVRGAGTVLLTQRHVGVFSIAYGKDADLDTLRVISQGTNGVSTTADPKNIKAVLETFGRYF